MWRGSKACNPVQAHMERRVARRQAATTLADAFPDVHSITIDLSFANAPDAPNPRLLHLYHSRSSRAFFEFKCPNWKCGLGGFDLGPVVERCVKVKRKTATGTFRCQGWCDPRHETERCSWVLSYEIHVT